MQKAKLALLDTIVKFSADVFGLTTSVQDDMGIGQKWSLIAQDVEEYLLWNSSSKYSL